MRNSFEDMKKLLVESEMNIIESTDKNTERSVQKMINGPRPQPLGPPRHPRRAFTEDDTIEDLPTKRRNVFRRALKGLSMRSSNDLSKIEDMYVDIIGWIEVLLLTITGLFSCLATSRGSKQLRSLEPAAPTPTTACIRTKIYEHHAKATNRKVKLGRDRRINLIRATFRTRLHDKLAPCEAWMLDELRIIESAPSRRMTRSSPVMKRKWSRRRTKLSASS